jgi:hypothetical protein
MARSIGIWLAPLLLAAPGLHTSLARGDTHADASLARGDARLGQAYAQDSRHSYALVIGSNRGGDGQAELSYAQHDARRMAELLRELGRTPEQHIQLLAEPSAEQVQQALRALKQKLDAHAAAGEHAQLVFYYSGHARAHALSLGDGELALSTLRASLLALPSTLTVVVLDACQSGAFSGVKGAAPAADFSISSVNNLHSSGVAVMASSTASELSQESKELGSSYFTHHLLVALRGAGDLDRNGRVSLDEAYGYAYQHTLSDTARTQVGSQHATLETELTGRGDVPLSYPIDADAQLAFAPGLEGRVLVQRAQRGAVVAELIKARGVQLLLALPSGSYEVLVRDDRGGGKSCPVTLARGQVQPLSLEQCRSIVLASASTKTDLSERIRERKRAAESWFLEAGLTGTLAQDDAYMSNLETFGYRETDRTVGGEVALGFMFNRYFGLLTRVSMLENKEYVRSLPGASNSMGSFGWTTYMAALGARARLPLASHWLVAFAELDVGVGFGGSQFYGLPLLGDELGDWSGEQSFRSPAVRGLAGFTVGFTRHFGAYLGAGYSYAPVLENALGQRHDSGGFTLINGLRLNGVKGWW